jgi:nucleoside-diphosphate-sugar epimerase
MPRRILITGASGRFGSALTTALGKRHAIAQLSLDEPAAADQRRLGPVHVGTVTDEAIVRDAMDGVDTVIHCASFPGAAEPFTRLMETNVLGTFTLLEEAGHSETVKQVIYVSSITWHGLHEQHGGQQTPVYLPIDEAHPSLATGYYDTSKVMAEHLCATFARRFRKPCVAIRPAWIIAQDLEPRFTAVPPVDGPHLNDYVGVSDLIDAVWRLLDYEPADGFEAMLFHAPDQRSTLPSGELAQRYYPGVKRDPAKLDRCDGFGALVDCTRAEERLGWRASYRCRRSRD